MEEKGYIDNGYYFVFGIYFIFCFILSIYNIVLKTHLAIGIVVFLITAVLSYFFYIRRYKLTKNTLKVTIGCFTINYNLKDIKKCYMTKNNDLSYALSTKRICIEFKNGKKIYISPYRMNEFLEKLKVNNVEEIKPKEIVKKEEPKVKEESVVKVTPKKKEVKKEVPVKKVETVKTVATKTAPVKKVEAAKTVATKKAPAKKVEAAKTVATKKAPAKKVEAVKTVAAKKTPAKKVTTKAVATKTSSVKKTTTAKKTNK